MSVAVSIINYNSKELLKPLLSSLLTPKIKDLEIWLIDNDSPDKGGAQLKKDFKEINLIESKENGGFAKGHNLALKKIKTDFILLLNPDTKVPAEAIEKMVKFMAQNPRVGAASCKLVYPDNKLQSNGGDLPFGSALLAWLFNLEMIPGLEEITGNFHRLDNQYYSRVHPVGWVGGTFMFLRRKALEEVGFLSEDYFMYFEDADLCYQLQKKGFKVMINPEVTVEHSGGASSQNPRQAQFKGEMKGLEIFYRREFGLLPASIIKLLIYIGIILRIAAFTLVGKPNIAKVYGKVIFAI